MPKKRLAFSVLALLVIIVCIRSALLRWNQIRYSKNGLPPETLDLPICRETTEFLKQQVSDIMKNQMLRIEEAQQNTISDLPMSHQVFLNFRGEQLRHNFISHLTNAFNNQGIKFFVDNDMLPGKDLKNLFGTIEESRIALAIFSTRYSESKWCLNELVKMKKLTDEGKLYVIPIFYKVDAWHVRKPTSDNEFGKNFWRLMEASDWRDPIQEWREALEYFGNKFGLSLGNKSSEADFVKKIVKEVERINGKIGLEEGKNYDKTSWDKFAEQNHS